MANENRGDRDPRPRADGPVTTAPRAKQGDRRSSTLWILFMAVILAGIVGMVLLSTTEDYTADQPNPAANAPASNSTPTTPGQRP